jgi:hypothetical protein
LESAIAMNGCASGAPSLDAIVELGIRADAVVADEKLRLDAGMGGDEVAHHRHHRVARGRHAEDQFECGIGEIERRAQRLLDEIVEPADRPHDGNGRRLAQRRDGRARAAADDRNDDAEDVKRRGDAAERGGCDDRKLSYESKYAAPD